MLNIARLITATRLARCWLPGLAVLVIVEGEGDFPAKATDHLQGSAQRYLRRVPIGSFDA